MEWGMEGVEKYYKGPCDLTKDQNFTWRVFITKDFLKEIIKNYSQIIQTMVQD